LDKDGVLDSTDRRVSGKRIYIDSNLNGKYDSGEKNALSNSSGVYTITGLGAGTYRVRRADLPSTYVLTVPVSGYHTVTLANGQSVTGKNFGDKPATSSSTVTSGGRISGTVFSDFDKDGVLDSSDRKLANKRIYIDSNLNGRYDSGEKSVLSNSSGVYTLSGLSAGTYRVRRADLPSAYTYTTPSSGYHSVVLSTNQFVSGKNFGDKPR
jgi:hypothetical protein